MRAMDFTTPPSSLIAPALARPGIQDLGGSLIRIDIARAAPVGTMTGWRPAMPVTQWRWQKPANKTRESE